MSARFSSLLLTVALMLVQHSGTGQPEPNRVGLVVVHGDGTIVKKCVEFSAESITGAEALQRAGLEPVLSSYGGLGYGICAIDSEGCAAGEDCFCQCRKSPCSYWVYSHRQQDGAWTISGLGASSWTLRSGDIDGWVWGDGTETPPLVTFEDVCPVEAKGVVASPGSATLESPTAAASSTPTIPQQTATPSPRGQVMANQQPAEETVPPKPDNGLAFPTKYVVFGVLLFALVGLTMFGGRVWH